MQHSCCETEGRPLCRSYQYKTASRLVCTYKLDDIVSFSRRHSKDLLPRHGYDLHDERLRVA